MNNRTLIADAHILANQQLERLRILLLLVIEGEMRGTLPDCQSEELDRWMLELAFSAQEHLGAAVDALVRLKGEVQ